MLEENTEYINMPIRWHCSEEKDKLVILDAPQFSAYHLAPYLSGKWPDVWQSTGSVLTIDFINEAYTPRKTQRGSLVAESC